MIRAERGEAGSEYCQHSKKDWCAVEGVARKASYRRGALKQTSQVQGLTGEP